MCYGLLPIFLPAQQETLLYWSNVIQLIALPLLMVGQNLQSKAADRRSLKTYDMVRKLFKELGPEYDEKKKKR
jgi:ribosomal protein L17